MVILFTLDISDNKDMLRIPLPTPTIFLTPFYFPSPKFCVLRSKSLCFLYSIVQTSDACFSCNVAVNSSYSFGLLHSRNMEVSTFHKVVSVLKSDLSSMQAAHQWTY